MRSSVITNNNNGKHFVENYRFKVLGSESKAEVNLKNSENKEQLVENLSDENFEQENIAQEMSQNSQPRQNSQQNNGFDASFVEELLKKTDELSTNIIKLQMQIENQEAEFKKRLDSEIARAYEDGKNEGQSQAELNFQSHLNELNDKFSSSVAKISAKFDEFDEFINKNEEELANTAISVAKKVIEGEISHNSAKIAENLSKHLLADLRDAKNITLRVNPDDSEYLKGKFSSHIKIEPDDAISKGGVVVISEAGNVDATLQTRLEKLKGLL